MSIKNNKLWALILGGSSGFGLATALELATKGYNLCIVHRTTSAHKKSFDAHVLEMKDKGAEVMCFNTNAALPEKADDIILALKTQLGSGVIGLLVHAIADGNIKPLASKDKGPLLSLDDLNYTVNAMGLSLVMWAQKVFTAEMFAPKASVIGFSSEWHKKVYPNYSAVALAKGVLEAACRYLAVELAPYGIRTNIINAGITPTPALMKMPDAQKTLDYTKNRNPFKRLTTPEDIAKIVALLASDDAAWINGEVIRADGGEQLVF